MRRETQVREIIRTVAFSRGHDEGCVSIIESAALLHISQDKKFMKAREGEFIDKIAVLLRNIETQMKEAA